MSMKEHLQQILQKYFEGKLNLKEQIDLSEQLADYQNNDAEQILHEEWGSQLASENFSNRSFKYLLDRVHHRIRLNENRKQINLTFWQTFQRIAAVLILPLLFSFLTYFYFQSYRSSKSPDNIAYAEIQCPLGGRTKFHLPDGTTGFLNSGSTLKYPVVFTRERLVELKGEAFFEVVHNAEIPFHVNTKNLDIKVLGTTFDVIANEDEKTEEVVLQTGKVDVSSRGGQPLTVMLPNDQLILNTNNLTFTTKAVETSHFISWKEGKLEFRNENMEQVARRLGRWYNADVVVEDQQLNNYTFHATFIDEPLDEVLKLISITTPISYSVVKRTSDNGGIFEKRKIILRINKLKINQFR